MLRAMMKRLSLSCILAFGLLGVAACGSAPPPPPVAMAPAPVDHYTGHWEGAARIATPIPGAPEQMDIVAVLIQGGGGNCGTIEYSHAGCSGVWNCTGTDYGGEVLAISENIRFGQERCPDGANVELRVTSDPNVLEFRYQHTQIQAVGQINRRAIQ